MTRGSRTGMLRFASEADLNAMKARRAAFNDGSRGRIVTPEREIQAAGLELLKHHPAVAFAYRQNTGAGMLIQRHVFERLVAAGHMRRDEARFVQFGVKGQHDVTGMLRGSGRRLEVEFKADGKKLTDEQRAVADATNAGGGLAVCAYSVTDIVKALE